jgi:hypothetical protein
MGIRFSCPNGHKLNVKEHLAGKRGICPACGASFVIPAAIDAAPAGDSPPAAGQGPPASRVTTPAQGPAGAGTSASASVVIATADAPPKPAPATASAAATPPVINVNSSHPSQTTAPAVTPAPPAETPFVLSSAPDNPAAAVSKYTAHRMRSRRLQTTIAISLLIAIVVLGIVLAWVLSGGPGTAQTRQASAPALSAFAYSLIHLLTYSRS